VTPNGRIVSSDSHVVEPPDTWMGRLPVKYRDRAPRVVQDADGDWWFVDGVRTNSFQGGAQTGKRFDRPDELRPAGRFVDVRPGAYDPKEFLADNDLDGVWGSVIYPTEGLSLYQVPDGELLTAIFAAYNDWLAEFCHYAPARLKGIATIHVEDVPAAIAELTRARTLGLVGAMITVGPAETASYDRPEYEAFWAAAQDLEMPLSLHIATFRPSPDIAYEDNRTARPGLIATWDRYVKVSLAHMILAGVFERYPRLRVGSVEHELGWVPFFLDRLDYTYTQRARRPWWHRFKDGLPSDFFHRNVFLSFQEDALGMRDRELIGVDQMMWGSDYPHTESTFPQSQKLLDRVFAGVADQERRRITCDNVARLYGFDVTS
jgi:predicted TIM-barrel fold metal-dependent hydrolase